MPLGLSDMDDGEDLWVKLMPANDGADGFGAPPGITVSRQV